MIILFLVIYNFKLFIINQADSMQSKICVIGLCNKVTRLKRRITRVDRKVTHNHFLCTGVAARMLTFHGDIV